MAIYHFTAQVIGRSTGRTATGAVAYRAGERIVDERTGQIFDYSRKRGIEHSEIVLPDIAPAWMLDRERLWNAVEQAEARRDAQVCREIEVALPRELSPDQRLDLLRGFVREEFVGRGMVADFSVHNPRGDDGLERPHSHILLTMRELRGDGFGKKKRDWNDKGLLEVWRERWADHVNRVLDRHGHSERIDHRSLETRREEALQRAADPGRDYIDRRIQELIADALDREAQPKLGRAATLERWGVQTERGDLWRHVRERNAGRRGLQAALRDIRDQVRNLVERGTDIVRTGVAALLGKELRSPSEPSVDALLGRDNANGSAEQIASTSRILLGRSEPLRHFGAERDSTDLDR